MSSGRLKLWTAGRPEVMTRRLIGKRIFLKYSE